MKKILFLTCLLSISLFSGTVFANNDFESTKDIIADKCSGHIYEESFLKGFSCTGAKSEIYHIGNKEVTKTEFEKQKKVFDEKGSICTETKKSTVAEMPKGAKYTCKAGEYGKYYIDNKKVSYGKFVDSVQALVFSQVEDQGNTERLNQLNQEKKLLKSIKTFKNALKASSDYTFSFPVVGSPCVGGGGMRLNGDGYSEAVCEAGKIQSVNYYFNNKIVSSETFIKAVYKTSKALNKSEIAYYSKLK